MKVREEAAAAAKAKALAEGKSEAEAAQIAHVAGLEAENAWYAGEQATGIEERTRLKAQLKEAEPLIAAGKAKLDGEKDAGTKLAEREAELQRERESRTTERRNFALREAAFKAGVKNPDIALRMVDPAAVTIGEDGKVAGADAAIAAIVKDVPGLVGEGSPPRSPGSGAPGSEGGGSRTMKRDEYLALPPEEQGRLRKEGVTLER